MKRTYLPLLLASALLLSGCGSRDEARFDAFAEELRSRGDIVMTAEVRAEQEDNTCTFTLRYAESTAQKEGSPGWEALLLVGKRFISRRLR